MRSRLIITFFIFLFLSVSIVMAGEIREPSKDQLSKLQSEYVKYCANIGITSKRCAKSLFDDKVNILKYEQFKELGIDLIELSNKLASGWNYKELALFSDMIVFGKIIDRKYEENGKLYFQTTILMEVKNILYGNDFLNPPPDTIVIKRQSGANNSLSTETEKFDIGKSYIVFLTKYGIDLAIWGIEGNIGANFTGRELNNDLKFANVFDTTPYSQIIVTDKKHIERTDGRKIPESLKSLKKLYRKLYKLNDPQNFYTRNYNKL